MIKILFKRKNDKFISFEIKGHSNLRGYGTDIVCSAVSSTTLMTLNGILEVLSANVEYTIDEGYTYCNFENLKDDKIYILINSYYLFLEELSKEYPKNINFKVMEV
ncbi:ribosomal-processing cysteine protease Prp [Caviibacter abscessus]|uniref:ribosomal-processing cysteine protease Prp n=1 Tax=Caviibacter abscessus TaxID=1766719 RepID=UPI0008297A44|nr:ribosomal-processing cysteine protease Prp [Caviibacter abscessus]